MPPHTYGIPRRRILYSINSRRASEASIEEIVPTEVSVILVELAATFSVWCDSEKNEFAYLSIDCITDFAFSIQTDFCSCVADLNLFSPPACFIASLSKSAKISADFCSASSNCAPIPASSCVLSTSFAMFSKSPAPTFSSFKKSDVSSAVIS